MALDKLFFQNSVIEAGMQAAIVRNEVINNNIANADTPNFKKQSVQFEDILSVVLERGEQTGIYDLGKASPRVFTIHQNYTNRLDGNNVDIEAENVSLYSNSVKYDTMVSSIINNYKRFNLVLSMR